MGDFRWAVDQPERIDINHKAVACRTGRRRSEHAARGEAGKRAHCREFVTRDP